MRETGLFDALEGGLLADELEGGRRVALEGGLTDALDEGRRKPLEEVGSEERPDGVRCEDALEGRLWSDGAGSG